jgi:hypothetical protein
VKRMSIVLAAAFLVSLQPARANHHAVSFTVSPATTSAYADIATTVDFGSNEPSTMGLRAPTGWLYAHQVATPPTPVSPIPWDEEQIGSGWFAFRWTHTFCQANLIPATVTWEADMTGKPANAVARWVITMQGLADVNVWIIRHGPGDYEERVSMPTSAICSSTTDGLFDFTVDCDLPSGRKVCRNPPASGTYTATAEYTDTTGTFHTASASTTIT